MNEEKSDYLRVLRLDRAQAIQLVLVGLVLALGVNLIADYADSRFSRAMSFLIGVVAVGVALGLALRSVYQPRPRYRQFEGFFIYDRRENVLVGHHSGYQLGHALARYIEAGLVEDGQINAIWDRNPISLMPKRGENGQGNPGRSLDLVRQACEYFVLRSFSTRLRDHFTSGEYGKDELATLSHTDLPEVLLQNRFLRTFAEPMEDRPTFPPNETARDTIEVSELGGALYERFELVHPKGWRVVRSGAEGIEIKTKRFVLRVEPRCDGYAVNLPPLYLSHYVRLEQEIYEKNLRFVALKIDVSIEIAPRRAWLMTSRGWRYYRWIDQWIADLEPQISLSTHLEEIGFYGAETTVQMLAGGGEEGAKSPEPPVHEQDAETRMASTTALGARTPFALGDQVEHVSFGRGRVQSVEPGGVIVVSFDGDDKEYRKLMADYAPIRRLP